MTKRGSSLDFFVRNAVHMNRRIIADRIFRFAGMDSRYEHPAVGVRAINNLTFEMTTGREDGLESTIRASDTQAPCPGAIVN